MSLIFIVLGVLKLGMNHDLCEEVLVSIRKAARSVMVHLLSAMVKEGGISHQFNEKSAQIGSDFTSFL